MPQVSAQKLALFSSASPLPRADRLEELGVTKEQIQKLYYRTVQSTDVPGRQPAKERDENFYDIHGIGQRPTRYMEVNGFNAPLVNRLACRHTKEYVPHALGDNLVNKALAKNFKEGFGAGPVGLYKPIGSDTMYQRDFPEVEPEELHKGMRNARQGNQKPPYVLTNTLGGLGDSLVKSSHEHNMFKEPRRDIMKARRESQPRPGLDIGGIAEPVIGRTDYDRQYGIEQATRGRNFLRKEASLPALGTWTPGMVPSLCCPDPHPTMMAGQKAKRVPMMSPGQ